MSTVLVFEQALDFADTQVILPSQQGDVAHQPWAELACGRIDRQLTLADAVAAEATTVKQLILGDIQPGFGQLKYLMALAWHRPAPHRHTRRNSYSADTQPAGRCRPMPLMVVDAPCA